MSQATRWGIWGDIGLPWGSEVMWPHHELKVVLKVNNHTAHSRDYVGIVSKGGWLEGPGH